ncbi:gamma-glutamyltransferase [Vreelandella utahensis]|uniref:gamma-glutamyltransferase n=1 Tax=Vreelandella halophila TaxID=86177 RepID=UPI0009869541|nr:gamma-glutamyltransferase [Halomonas utahensis]
MRRIGSLFTAALAALLIAGCAHFGTPEPNAGVASAHPMATEAGLQALENGGNAVDAAIATAAALGVVEPYSSGIGGGGFWVIQQANGESVVIDAREEAPGEAHPELYLNDEGEVREDKPSLNGALAAGIPGQPAAFDHMASEYGRLPLTRSLEPAIRLAREGFPVDERYRNLAGFRLEVMRDYPGTRALFLDDGDVPEEGHAIRQPALARTLETLAREGRSGFYRGPVAKQLVADARQAGGIWTLDDLADYDLIERAPVRIDYGNATLLTAPAPSSGGMALAQLFGMLEQRPVPEDAERVTRVHWLAEMMRRAYRDRAVHMGDPAYTEIPRERLRDPAYLRTLASSLNPDRATPSADLGGPGTDGRHTTHLSVMDAEGNIVSATLSINYPFGSGVTSADTGVVLNNEMNDFSIRPGHANAWGLVGGKANQVEAGKRPLSSMSPLIIRSPERVTALGAPGGSRIITMNFLAALDVLEGMDPDAVVAGRRFHHQYQPDRIEHEPETFSPAEKQALRAMGHELHDVERTYGNMQLIQRNRRSDIIRGAADPRGIGSAGLIHEAVASE